MRHPWNLVGGTERRRSKWRGVLGTTASFAGGALIVGALAATLTGLSATKEPGARAAVEVTREVSALRHELEDAKGKLALAEVRIARMNAVAKYSALYRIPADLAGAIHDIALAEGIHPSLGYQLVKVESNFRSGARSEKGAIGYAQVRLKTARGYDSTLTERALHDRDTNLRIGFRFLKDMLDQFDQDLSMALVAYNRGPTRVADLISQGENPANGYAEAVLKGVKKGS